MAGKKIIQGNILAGLYCPLLPPSSCKKRVNIFKIKIYVKIKILYGYPISTPQCSNLVCVRGFLLDFGSFSLSRYMFLYLLYQAVP